MAIQIAQYQFSVKFKDGHRCKIKAFNASCAKVKAAYLRMKKGGKTFKQLNAGDIIRIPD